jgi:hypothetical protein
MIMFADLQEAQNELHTLAREIVDQFGGEESEGQILAVSEEAEMKVTLRTSDRTIEVEHLDTWQTIRFSQDGECTETSLRQIQKFLKDTNVMRDVLTGELAEVPVSEGLAALRNIESSVEKYSIRLSNAETWMNDQERLQMQLEELGLLSDELLYTAFHESRLPAVLCEGIYIPVENEPAYIYANSIGTDEAGDPSIRFEHLDIFDYLVSCTDDGSAAYIAVFDNTAFYETESKYIFLDQDTPLNALRAVIHIEDFHLK